MQIYYYVYLVIVLVIAILFILYAVQKRRNISVSLFAEALKNENNGDFEEAMISYGNALDEVNKFGFQCNLKSKIVQKLRVLNTVIEYKNNSHFTRQYNEIDNIR